MLLTVHATAGAIIGQHVKNPVLAFTLAFLSHFLLDIIPHGDQGCIDEYKNGPKNKVKQIMSVMIIDASVMLILVISKFYFKNFTPTLSVAAGIIGGILPDLIVGCHELSDKLFQKFNRFHFLMHDMIKLQPSMASGLFFQAIILGVMFFYV